MHHTYYLSTRMGPRGLILRAQVEGQWIRLGREKQSNGYCCRNQTTMATLPSISSSFLPTTVLTIHSQYQQFSLFYCPNRSIKTSQNHVTFKVQAAKLPAGVELPKVEPKFKAPFLGFTRTAEIWNSRACMIGLSGTFSVELIINKGILQVIGLDIGKGLDLPL